MNNVPKLLIVAGAVLVLIGAVWMLGGRWFGLGRLPGDIVVEKGDARFYFPIVTCILISVVGTVILSVVRWLTK
ncbi:DUF2905 domain-containing protein [Paenibacillus sp. IB182496]|uniref:DUF2905 domain-containing protein n=1 Tax=Paenibacillus sabuli TaxID=2772509 RepID=A0A927BTT7_9BACL|nr:DUF2905 domain-containing protein [Paenibacillus sabuli]MBD2845645.1 DUF2905 domain-containing protein [Paenibacillus sabuli]